ncbi:rubredoxin [Bradyrhizobium sp. AZCC 1588]|uniref:hypothetical protein n=1 Tax=unclassified Bradyrhizobium TaxID=2631580 RepID=UPI002FF228AF
MARFRCRACGEEVTFVYDVYARRHVCPRCGFVDVQFALSIEEVAADDPLITALAKLAESDPPDTET